MRLSLFDKTLKYIYLYITINFSVSLLIVGENIQNLISNLKITQTCFTLKIEVVEHIQYSCRLEARYTSITKIEGGRLKFRAHPGLTILIWKWAQLLFSSLSLYENVIDNKR